MCTAMLDSLETAFGRALRWDVSLTEGYRCRVLRAARPGESVGSDSFRGVDVPEIGAPTMIPAGAPGLVLTVPVLTVKLAGCQAISARSPAIW